MSMSHKIKPTVKSQLKNNLHMGVDIGNDDMKDKQTFWNTIKWL